MESEYSPIAQAEKDSGKKISLQFGNHDAGLIDGDIIKTVVEIRKGRLDIHAWDEATRERICAERAEVLTIDSLHLDDINELHPEYIWYLLPDRPSNLNMHASVEVIAGDVRFSRLIEKSHPQIDKIDSEHVASQIRGQYFARIGDTPIAMAIGLAAVLSSSKDTKLTRRQLLQYGGLAINAAAASLIVAKLGLPSLHTQITDPDMYANVVKVSEVLRPYMTAGFQWAKDGRTALAIAKSLDYNSNTTTVLYGSGHAEANVSGLLHNVDTRNRYIRRFMEKSMEMIEDFENKFPSLKPQNLKDKLHDTVAAYDVLTIRDPLLIHDYQGLGQCIDKKETRVCKEIQDAL